MPMPRALRSPLSQAALIVGIGMLIYLPWLGYSGLSASEGFRALPAWQALQAAHSPDPGTFADRWLITRLFEQPYLRKPPGIVWAIGLSSSLLGPTEFAARAVSAIATIASAMVAWWFARRWFGPGVGLMSGLLLLLTPVLWSSARSAEIEALHDLFAMASCLLILDLTLARKRSAIEAFVALEPSPDPLALPAPISTAALALSSSAMLLTKGPAAVPFLLCTLIAASLALRDRRVLMSVPVWCGLLAGGAVFGIYLLIVSATVSRLAIVPVTQEPSEFLWRSDRIGDILTLPISSLISAFPASIAVPALLWWWFARLPGAAGRAGRLGVAIGLAFALSALVFTVMGVGNSRYMKPAVPLLPIAAAYAAAFLLNSKDPADVRFACLLQLRRPRVWALVLLASALAHAAWLEVRRENRTSGRAAGIALAQLLPDGATLVADQSIDTRPEVFWYAQREAEKMGRTLRVIWRPASIHGTSLPPPGTFIALRNDDRDEFGRELARFEELATNEASPLTLEPIYSTRVHVFELRVFRVR
jgi:4-amino-4-deoxy-L-arabinose transferase-like glycosyltransferase